MTPAGRFGAVAAFCAAALAAAASQAQNQRRPIEENLLPSYVVLDEKVQLEDGRRQVSSYEDVEYAPSVGDCSALVERHVSDWLSRMKMVASARVSKPPRYRVEIDMQSPGPGTLIVDYLWTRTKRQATLDISYRSGERLSPAERERLVLRLDLVGLRSRITGSMKCA